MTEAALVQWVPLIAVISIFGLTGFALWFAPRDVAAPAAFDRAMVRTLRVLATISLALAPVTLLFAVAQMANVSITRALPFVPEVLNATHTGRLWLWSAPLQAALCALAWARLNERARRGALFAASGGLLLLGSLGTHAIDKGWLHLAAQFIHEVCAASWLGALAVLCLAAVADRGGRADLIERGRWLTCAIPRVSSVAGWSVAILALTGIYNAYAEIGLNLDHLMYSDYGTTLIYKVITFGVVICIGGYNRYRLLPRIEDSEGRAALMRNVAVETALLVCVLGWSALLANSPPPH